MRVVMQGIRNLNARNVPYAGLQAWYVLVGRLKR